jgi:uncharacterized membrane protein YbhN (UPF0104 family)
VIDWLSKNRQNIARVGGSFLALILFLILLKEESTTEIISDLKRISIWYFLAAIFTLMISRLMVTGRWYALLRSAGVEISFWQTAKLTFTGLFSSNFLPTTIGGDVVRLAGAMQMGYDRPICLASMIADRLIGMASMIVTLPLGLIPALSLGKQGLAESAVFLGLYQKGMDFFKRILESFKIWYNKPMGLALSLLSSLGNMAFIFASVYLLIEGMELHVSYWLVAGIWSLAYFPTLIPISINGWGVQELSLAFLLTNLGGLEKPESAVIAVLIRLVFMIASLPGAYFLPSILAEMNKNPSVMRDS